MVNDTTKVLKEIQFGLFGPQQIIKMAVAKIVTPELYDREGYPVDGGLMDIRLGVIDPGLRCKTCGGRIKECMGHFGYIELARPVLHYKYLTVIYDILRSICNECSRVLIPDNKINRYKSIMDASSEELGLQGRRARIKEIIRKLKTTNKCPHCKAKKEKITLDKPYTLYEGERKLSPIEIRTRLEKIKEEDLGLFGINPSVARPEWAILTVLPIPPVTTRPSITLESGERSEDDLTHKLGDIVRINQRLFENINAGAPEVIIDDLWELLQYHISTLFDNEIPNIPPARHRSGQPLKTITDRIKSKQGRIRYNLAGKRTNFSARTVISPDPLLNINEVGVPYEIASDITIPERVNEWNIERAKEFVTNGPLKYPGAKYIMRPDGRRKKITSETKEEILEELVPGYTIERHMMDGDVVLFNRQPSLHRMSMMCHKVRVLPGRTFRLNPMVCNPYNADFDGDEMNLHVPQTEEAQSEAENLMLVDKQIISPRYGLSVIGAIKDIITGLYLLTRNYKVSRGEAIDMLISAGVDNIRLPNKKMIDGKEIFSALLPEDIDYKGKNRAGEEVVIENGVLIKGTVDAGVVGKEKGLLLRRLYTEYGSGFTTQFLARALRLSMSCNIKKGLTMPITDLDLPVEAASKIQTVIADSEKEVNKMIGLFKGGKLEAFPGRSMEETLEIKVVEILNKARDRCGDIVAKYGPKDTFTLAMIEGGGGGNMLNLSQISGLVGQQALWGKRISKGYSGRTLSYFKKGDLSAAARGFIKNSFKMGMTPEEFFFAALTGRDSLMDTALRTPKSGYLYRRLSNALQDLKVEYDHTVRDAEGNIVQFFYGEDGIDVSKSNKGKLDLNFIEG